MSTRPRFHPDDGRPRYTGPAVVTFPDGCEAPVTVSLVLRYDPSRSDNRESDRDSTWAGSVTRADESSDVDLFDARLEFSACPTGARASSWPPAGRASPAVPDWAPPRSSLPRQATVLRNATRAPKGT